MGTDAGIPFGKYTLLKRIARGGMAEVFLARQKGLEDFHRYVAVKRILPHLVDDEDFVRMFLDEARLAARLSHPNIIHIYDFGKVDEHYFIAMEFMGGVHAGDIIRLAASEPLPPTLVARIGADACAGLHYAHMRADELGRPLELVHRDVSPPNLLVSNDGVIKLVDFGIAKAVNSIGQTRPGVVKGKYAYMSPEQTTGKKLDGRSDVFSLGLVLWEMLAGRTAVTRSDQVLAMKTIRDGNVPPIEEIRPSLPSALAQALGHALVTQPGHRADARQLGQKLEAFIKSSRELGSNMELGHWIREKFPQQPTVSAPAAGPGTRQSTLATSADLSLSADLDASEHHAGTSRGSVVARLQERGDSLQVSAASGDLPPPPRADSDFDDDPTRALREPHESILVDGDLESTPSDATSVTAAIAPAALRGAASFLRRGEENENLSSTDESPRNAVDPRIQLPSNFEETRAILPRNQPAAVASLSTPEVDELVSEPREVASLPADDPPSERDRRRESTSLSAKSPAGSRQRSPPPRGAAPPSQRPSASRKRPRASMSAPEPGAQRARPTSPRRDAPVVEHRPPAASQELAAPPRRARSSRPVAVPRSRVLPVLLGGFVVAAFLASASVYVLGLRDDSRPLEHDKIAAPRFDAAHAPFFPDAQARAIPPIVVTPLRDAAHQAGHAVLQVRTRPSGAEVFVRGRSSEAPVAFGKLQPGTYSVTAFHRRHQLSTRDVTLRAGEHREIEIRLRPLGRRQRSTKRPEQQERDENYGRLMATSQPFASVYLGALKLGVTPLANVQLPAGTYQLRFKTTKHPPLTREVTIESGRTQKIEVTF